jgi:hypothetical protein
MGRLLIAGEPGARSSSSGAAAEANWSSTSPARAPSTPPGWANLKTRWHPPLIFAGVTTEVCVQTTMREANDRGFECLLARMPPKATFPHFKTATLEMIRAQGAIVGWGHCIRSSGTADGR